MPLPPPPPAPPSCHPAATLPPRSPPPAAPRRRLLRHVLAPRALYPSAPPAVPGLAPSCPAPRTRVGRAGGPEPTSARWSQVRVGTWPGLGTCRGALTYAGSLLWPGAVLPVPLAFLVLPLHVLLGDACKEHSGSPRSPSWALADGAGHGSGPASQYWGPVNESLPGPPGTVAGPRGRSCRARPSLEAGQGSWPFVAGAEKPPACPRGQERQPLCGPWPGRGPRRRRPPAPLPLFDSV